MRFDRWNCADSPQRVALGKIPVLKIGASDEDTTSRKERDTRHCAAKKQSHLYSPKLNPKQPPNIRPHGDCFVPSLFVCLFVPRYSLTPTRDPPYRRARSPRPPLQRRSLTRFLALCLPCSTRCFITPPVPPQDSSLRPLIPGRDKSAATRGGQASRHRAPCARSRPSPRPPRSRW